MTRRDSRQRQEKIDAQRHGQKKVPNAPTPPVAKDRPKPPVAKKK